LSSKGAQAQYGVDIGVLVLSSRVGGVGVTLTAARHLVVFEPCSDPALDEQVIKRFHRTGQNRDCIIYRLIVSWMGIEGKIYDRVERKKVMTDIFMTEKGV
jgi:SNF2 family DNA or RNA helicase